MEKNPRTRNLDVCQIFFPRRFWEICEEEGKEEGVFMKGMSGTEDSI